MTSKLTVNDILNYAAENPKMLRVKECDNGMRVLKYSHKAFYRGVWDPELREARGLVIDAEDSIVAYPFSKAFGLGFEKDAGEFDDDEEVTIFRKINGFLGVISMHCGEYVFSTTGSIDSPFVQYIKDMVDDDILKGVANYPEHTHMFEVVHPDDPHIVVENCGMYYLGSRKKEIGSPIENLPMDCGLPVETARVTFGEAKKLANLAHHEGFMVYAPDGRCGKLKAPYYVALKILARSNEHRVFSKGIMSRIDDQYSELLEHVRKFGSGFFELDAQSRLRLCRGFIEKNAS